MATLFTLLGVVLILGTFAEALAFIRFFIVVILSCFVEDSEAFVNRWGGGEKPSSNDRASFSEIFPDSSPKDENPWL